MLKQNLLGLKLFIWAVAIALCCQLFLTFSSFNKTPHILVRKTADQRLLELAELIKLGGIGLEDSKLRQEASDILKLKPIDDGVFLQLAYTSYLKTGYWDQINLLYLGHKRNPRNKNILKALGDAHLREKDVPSAISVLDLLLRLDPENRESYYPILSNLYKTKVGAQKIDTYLFNTPAWGHAFINREINTADLANIESISTSLRQFSQNNNDTEMLSRIWKRLIKTYVKLGEIQVAYDIWLSRSNQSLNLIDVQNTRGVYDSNFKEPKALQPFNWVLNNGKSYISERNGSGGLFVSFNDVKPRKVAWQVFPLDLDTSQVLSTQASWNYNNDQAYFEWRLMCSGSRKILGKLIFDDVRQSGSKITEPIGISDIDCPFVELQLWGSPGAYSKRISINVASVSVTGLGQESEG